jgi:hypothetical protein
MKTLTILTLAGTLAVAAPAVAGTSPDADVKAPSAQQQCRTERAGMGREAFAKLYGANKNRRNAFGRCVSKRAKATEKAAAEAKVNASQACKAERAADPKAFAAKYGTGKHGANALGTCVSQQARAKAAETVEEQVEADVEAAKACKAERKADPKAFAAKYGTNRNQRNAFGKCVSKQKAAAHA